MENILTIIFFCGDLNLLLNPYVEAHKQSKSKGNLHKIWHQNLNSVTYFTTFIPIIYALPGYKTSSKQAIIDHFWLIFGNDYTEFSCNCSIHFPFVCWGCYENWVKFKLKNNLKIVPHYSRNHQGLGLKSKTGFIKWIRGK